METVCYVILLSEGPRSTDGNFYRMIDNNLGSALILESDADWDMRIKDSMFGLTNGVRQLADFPFANHTVTPIFTGQAPNAANASDGPYGNGWDILWMGHCGANGGEDPRHYAYHDPSAGDWAHAWTFDAGPPDYYGQPQNTRLVFQLRAVTCTPAYAISNRGAQRLLEYFQGANQPFDMELKGRCLHEHDLVCLSTFPQIFSVAPSPSNIGDEAEGNPERPVTADVKAGYGLQISARVNANMGLDLQHPDQWKKEYNME